MNDLINTLDLYLGKKAPKLPKGLKDLLVKFGPWGILIGAIIMIQGIYATYFIVSRYTSGMGDFLSMFGMGDAARGMRSSFSLGTVFKYMTIASYISLAVIACQIIALPGLFKRKASGWNFLFYASLLNILSGILSGNIVGAIIFGILGLYVLFQIKGYYFGLETVSDLHNTNDPQTVQQHAQQPVQQPPQQPMQQPIPQQPQQPIQQQPPQPIQQPVQQPQQPPQPMNQNLNQMPNNQTQQGQEVDSAYNTANDDRPNQY